MGTWAPKASITASSPWPCLCSLCLSCHGRHRNLSAWLRPSLSIVCTAATALFAIKLTLSNIYIRTHCRTMGQCITVNGPLVLFRLDALTRRALAILRVVNWLNLLADRTRLKTCLSPLSSSLPPFLSLPIHCPSIVSPPLAVSA